MSSERTWSLRAPSVRAPGLARAAGISPLQAQLLINRGLVDAASARAFLSPVLSDMADPSLLKDMDEATTLILRCLEEGRLVTIYGDYDADGLCATAIIHHFFTSIGARASFYVPNRLREGYGLNREAVVGIAGKGTGCLITVDCGSTAVEEIALARSLGLEVVVTDHHQMPADLRPPCPVINPHRPDCAFPFKGLAGAGVAFLLAVSLRRALRERGRFSGRAEPDLRAYLDLVALGTVADRMPLLDQNRIFVNHGLGVLSRTSWQGLRALKAASDLRAPVLTATDLAFRMAPRLNAPGRMNGPEPAMEILLATDPVLADELAAKINLANQERQEMERRTLNAIEAHLACGEGAENRRILFLVGEDWHPGILGIVASRLVDRYHRPAFVCARWEDRIVGSARSIEGFHVHRALQQVSALLEKFGGHAHAAGFAFARHRQGEVKAALGRLAEASLPGETPVPAFCADGELALDGIGIRTVEEIERLAPFGEGNPEPVFLAQDVVVCASRGMGGGHLRLSVRQGRRVLEAVGFGLVDRLVADGSRVDLLFVPEINAWQGQRAVRLRLVDLRPSRMPVEIIP